MKVKANQTFKDIESGTHRFVHSKFDVTKERRKELGDLVSEVDDSDDEKQLKNNVADKTDKKASASKTKEVK